MSREIDLLDGRLYSGDLGGPHEIYAWMREQAPVHHDRRTATYDAVREASVDRDRWSTAGGIRPDSGPLPMTIDMDDPDHVERRRLVSRGVTPRRVRDKEAYLRELCDELMDAVC